MKKYAIVSANGVVTGWLHYNEVTETGNVELNRACPPEEFSPLLRIVYNQGDTWLGEERTNWWIDTRVCPPGRENIDEILEAYGIDHYNQFLISIAIGGRTTVDYDHFEEVEQ